VHLQVELTNMKSAPILINGKGDVTDTNTFCGLTHTWTRHIHTESQL